MDRIAEEFGRQIRHYCCLNFDNFTISATVSPVNRKAYTAIYDSTGTFIGFDRYVFAVWGEQDKEVDIDIDHNGVLRVWHVSRWATPADFVSLLRPQPDRDSALSTSQGRYRHQWNWWRANGKSFRLLDLPAEIRETIYYHAIGFEIKPYPTAASRRRGCHNQAIKQRNPNTAILLLNKLVHREAGHILHNHTPFVVEQRRVLRALVQNLAQRNLIHRLELALSHSDFFKVFGFQFGEELQIRPRNYTQAFRQMRLTHLELIVAAPSLTTESVWFDGACQTTVVDWILEAAYPWLRGHPVKVSGYIKSRQKIAFEKASLQEQKRLEVWRMERIAFGLTEGTLEEFDEWTEEQLDEEDGGVMLEGGSLVEAGIGLPSTEVEELPPRCKCSVPCTVEEWDADA